MQAAKPRKQETEKQETRFPPKTKGKKKIRFFKKEIHQPNATGRACGTKEVKDGQGS